MIIVVLFSVILIAFFFAAFENVHRADAYDEEAIKLLMCQDAQEICNQDCDHCAWGKVDVK